MGHTSDSEFPSDQSKKGNTEPCQLEGSLVYEEGNRGPERVGSFSGDPEQVTSRGRVRTPELELSLSFLAPDEARARTPHSDGDRTSENRHLGEGGRTACPSTSPQDLPHLTEALRGHTGSTPSPRKRTS